MRDDWKAGISATPSDKVLTLSQDENKSLMNAGLRQISQKRAQELLTTEKGQKPNAVCQMDIGIKGENRIIWVCQEHFEMNDTLIPLISNQRNTLKSGWMMPHPVAV